jgi:hypothetical protein
VLCCEGPRTHPVHSSYTTRTVHDVYSKVTLGGRVVLIAQKLTFTSMVVH